MRFDRLLATLFAVLTCFALAPRVAFAEAEPRAYHCGACGSPEETLEKCRETYFPELEVRILQDMPINVLITIKDGKATPGAAAGLDVLGLWWTPVRSKCIIADEDKTRGFAAVEGLSFSVIGTFNAAYSIFSEDTTLPVSLENPDAGSSPVEGSIEVERALHGAYFSGAAGVLLDYSWRSGGHGNRVALGFLARMGYLVGNDSQWLFTFGPAINVSLY